MSTSSFSSTGISTTTNLRDNNPFTQRTRHPLPIGMCAFAAGMSDEDFDYTFSTPGDILLGAFGKQSCGTIGRARYIATFNIGEQLVCTTAEAAGPLQALCYMLDDQGYHLDVHTFRQRHMPENPTYQYATFLEIENRYFTHWAIGYGNTSEEASLNALITGANQLRHFQEARRRGESTSITYTGGIFAAA